MTAVLSDDLREARRIVFGRLHGLPARVFLFGSRARGDARRTSDIDIAIDAGSEIPPWILAELRDALEESHILPRVDIVDLSSASAGLREAVLREGIEWTAPADQTS